MTMAHILKYYYSYKDNKTLCGITLENDKHVWAYKESVIAKSTVFTPCETCILLTLEETDDNI